MLYDGSTNHRNIRQHTTSIGGVKRASLSINPEKYNEWAAQRKVYSEGLTAMQLFPKLMMGDRGPNCDPVVPPTPKAKQHRIMLMVCGFVQLTLAICLCFINPMGGIYEIIDVAILFCALA
jgi:hypothetical protein